MQVRRLSSMYEILSCVLFALCLTVPTSGIEANSDKIIDGQLHEVKAKSGDGVFTILKRYELHREKIYHEAFRHLNDLSDDSGLYKNRSYKLPVFLYNYNGKSIRSTIGINDWDKAIRIKEYNEKLLDKGIRQTHYTSSKILWVPFAEINDLNSTPSDKPIEQEEILVNAEKPKANIPTEKSSASKIPAVGTKFTSSIFGNKYNEIQLVDNSLYNKVFYIVSGHGGPDPGAVCSDCSTKLCEDEYAYDVSLRLARRLMEHGAIVELVIQDKSDGIRDTRTLKCDRDEKLANGKSIPRKQLARLQQRTSYINDKYKRYKSLGITDQVVVSMHVDSNNESHKQDVFFCYYKSSESSKQLASQLRDKFEEKYSIHQKNKKYEGYLVTRNLYVLKNTAPPAVLIELANIRNKFNHKRILNVENRQALANWIFEGLVDDNRALASN